MKKRIILANAAVNSGNKGCTALSYSAIYFIDKVLLEQNVEYELYLTDSGHKDKKSHTLSMDGKTIYYHLVDYPVGIGLKQNIRKAVFFHKTISGLRFFKNADYILDIGQGDSFSDIYGRGRFNDIDRIHRLARSLNVPYCLLPQTIGPFTNPDIKNEAIKSIAKASNVMARDKMSYDYVLSNVPGQKNVDEYMDVAFYLPYEKAKFDERFVHVGLNVSGLLWHGGYTGNNELGLKDDYQKVVRAIIEYFLSCDNVMLHLIPHVVSQERVLENDYSVSIDLVKEYNNSKLVISPFFFSPIDAKSYISGLDFFMGARMHSTIAAFSSGVPVVPMAYSRKFNGLFGETLKYEYFVDLKKENSNTIVDKIQKCFSHRDDLKMAIQAKQSLIDERGVKIQLSLKKFFGF